VQRVVAAREPRRHRCDLRVSVLLKHLARIAVRTDRGLYLFMRRAWLKTTVMPERYRLISTD
jgi:hypothetical protein